MSTDTPDEHSLTIRTGPPVPPVCPYCGGTSEHVDSAVVYGTSYGMIWLCRPCRAYVGSHKASGEPLGTLADARTRAARRMAHDAFDPLWRRNPRTRSATYAWLADCLGRSVETTHIGLFDAETCAKVVQVCRLPNALMSPAPPVSNPVLPPHV